MKGLKLLTLGLFVISFAVLLVGCSNDSSSIVVPPPPPPPPPDEPIYDKASRGLSFGNNLTRTPFYAPGVNGNRSFSLVSIYGVDNATDDDAQVDINVNSERSFSVSTWQGNNSNFWQVWTASYELPPWAGVSRKTLTLNGKKDIEFAEIAIPEGYEGFGMLENLTYDSDGDDDAYIVWRCWSIGNRVLFVGATDRGDPDGRYVARCTVVYWKKGRNVTADLARVVVRNNGSGSISLEGCEGVVHMALTTYSTEFKSDLLDKIDDAVRKQAKLRVNPILFNRLGLAIGDRAISIDPETVGYIISALKIIIPPILKLFAYGDPYDDDASAVVTRNGCGGTMNVFDANSNFAAELSVWKLDFNP